MGSSVSSCLCLEKLILGLPLTNMSHLCMFAAHFAIYIGGTALYITASVSMVDWYYRALYYSAQHARGVSCTELYGARAMAAVLASAGIVVANVAYRVWPLLSVPQANQVVSCKLAAA